MTSTPCYSPTPLTHGTRRPHGIMPHRTPRPPTDSPEPRTASAVYTKNGCPLSVKSSGCRWMPPRSSTTAALTTASPSRCINTSAPPPTGRRASMRHSPRPRSNLPASTQPRYVQRFSPPRRRLQHPVDWTDVATNETGYVLERSVTAAIMPFQTLPPDTTHTDDTTQPNTLYAYRVRTVNAASRPPGRRSHRDARHLRSLGYRLGCREGLVPHLSWRLNWDIDQTLPFDGTMLPTCLHGMWRRSTSRRVSASAHSRDPSR